MPLPLIIFKTLVDKCRDALYSATNGKGEEMTKQTLFPGVLTEDDIFRQCMRKIGAKGGHANTDAQRKARSNNLRKAREAKAARAKEEAS